MALKTRKPMPHWQIAVRELLATANISESQLARKTRVNQSVAHRYLDGKHEPKAETVQKVNRAVASLVAGETGDLTGIVSRASIYDYLTLVYEVHRAQALNDPEAAYACVMQGIIESLYRIKHYLVLDPDEVGRLILPRLSDLWNTRGGMNKLVNVFSFVLLLCRRHILGSMTQQVPKKTLVDGVLDTFEQCNIDLSPYLLPERDTIQSFAAERFHLSVLQTLASARSIELQLRWRLIRSIEASYDTAVNAIVRAAHLT